MVGHGGRLRPAADENAPNLPGVVPRDRVPEVDCRGFALTGQSRTAAMTDFHHQPGVESVVPGVPSLSVTERPLLMKSLEDQAPRGSARPDQTLFHEIVHDQQDGFDCVRFHARLIPRTGRRSRTGHQFQGLTISVPVIPASG